MGNRSSKIVAGAVPFLLMASCMTAAPPASETYRALGQEPGWTLTIGADSILYLGDYGETHIDLPTPISQPTFNGRRYDSGPGVHRLQVDVTHTLCHDGMSGRAFADTVIVVADGNEVRGCGGVRVPGKDM